MIPALLYLIYGELLLEVRVSASAAHVLLHDALYSLLLQTVCHIIERILIRQSRYRLRELERVRVS